MWRYHNNFILSHEDIFIKNCQLLWFHIITDKYQVDTVIADVHGSDLEVPFQQLFVFL